MIYGLAVGGLAGHEAAGHHGALHYGVSLAVDTLETRQEKESALKIGGVADGCRSGVDMDAFLREPRQRGRYHHRGRVTHGHCGGRDGHSHLLEKIGQALRGKQGLLAVAGSVQANHQAVQMDLWVPCRIQRE